MCSRTLSSFDGVSTISRCKLEYSLHIVCATFSTEGTGLSYIPFGSSSMLGSTPIAVAAAVVIYAARTTSRKSSTALTSRLGSPECHKINISLMYNHIIGMHAWYIHQTIYKYSYLMSCTVGKYLVEMSDLVCF